MLEVVKMMDFSFGKRNRPIIVFPFKTDFENYRESLTKSFSRPSSYRSKCNEVQVFVGGVLISYCWNSGRGIAALFSAEDLEKISDPTATTIFCGGVRTLSMEKEIHVKKNALFWFENEPPKLASMPRIPDNAWLIRINPLTWIQVCKHGFLITRGAFWCDEEIGETSYSEHGFGVSRHGDKWLVMLPRIVYSRIPYYDLFVATEGRFIQEWHWGNVSDGVVFKNSSYEISFDGDNYRGSEYFERLPKEYLRMVKIHDDDKVIYVPYAHIVYNPDMKRLVSGVFP